MLTMQTLVDALPMPDFSDVPCDKSVIIQTLKDVKEALKDGYNTFICLTVGNVHRDGWSQISTNGSLDAYRSWMAEVGCIRVAIEDAVTSVTSFDDHPSIHRFISGGQGVVGTAMYVFNRLSAEHTVEYTQSGVNKFCDLMNDDSSEWITSVDLRLKWIDRIVAALES